MSQKALPFVFPIAERMQLVRVLTWNTLEHCIVQVAAQLRGGYGIAPRFPCPPNRTSRGSPESVSCAHNTDPLVRCSPPYTRPFSADDFV